MFKLIAEITIAGILAFSFSYLYAGEKSSKKGLKVQTTCPVMGAKINKNQYIDVKGKRIYVCCKGCISAIKKDPDKYINKLESKGVKIQELKKQTTCPVMKGNPVNKSIYADVKGKRIYVCCPPCKEKIKANPDKYIKFFKNKGVLLEDIPKKQASK